MAFQVQGKYDVVVIGEGSLDYVNGLLKEVVTGERPKETGVRNIAAAAAEEAAAREKEREIEQAIAMSSF